MPELPDVLVYIEQLEERILGQVLEHVRLLNPFLLRTFDPPIGAAAGQIVRQLRRIGKRIVICLDDDLFLVIHLMIAGRLHWKSRGSKPPGRIGLAAFDFPNGTLTWTEAGTKRRASLYLVRGESALAELDPGGLEVLGCKFATFRRALVQQNHTLKRALTDPRLLSGIGNAYSDEILYRAGLSPLAMTQKMTDAEIDRLLQATRDTLIEWTDRLRRECGEGFPENVTAFRDGMAVHGRYGQPCPACHATVQRIIYAENETNYCPRCQTGGKILADRSLSRLLKKDWPRTIEDIEEAERRR
jgi:formamidopyrimidine-DNA glycosylase